MYPSEEELGDKFCSYFRGSAVKGYCYLKSPFKNLFAGRNKYDVRNYLHRRGTAGFGLLTICTCILVSTWVCLSSFLELGDLRTRVNLWKVVLSAALVFGSCPVTSFCLGLVISS